MKKLDTPAEVATDAARHPQEPAGAQAAPAPVRPGRGARRHVRLRRVRAHRHPRPLLRRALRRRRSSPLDVYVAAKPKRVGSTSSRARSRPAGRCRPTWSRRWPRNAGVAEAAGTVYADGARLIGSNGKVVTCFGPPQARPELDRRERPARAARRAARRSADDEIVINAALAEAGEVSGRRPGRRADPGAEAGVHPRRHLRLQRRPGLPSAAATRSSSPRRWRSSSCSASRDVFTHVTVAGRRRGPAPSSCATHWPAAWAATTRSRPASSWPPTSSAGLKEGLSFFNKILLGFAGVALLVGTFLILNTFSIIVAQRTRELALMRAIGASRRQVIGSVLLEAVVIGLLASVLGLAAGIGVGAAAGVPVRTVRRRPDPGRAGRAGRGRDQLVRGGRAGHRARRAAAGAAGLPDPADRRDAGRRHPRPAADQGHHRRRPWCSPARRGAARSWGSSGNAGGQTLVDDPRRGAVRLHRGRAAHPADQPAGGERCSAPCSPGRCRASWAGSTPAATRAVPRSPRPR